MSRHPTAPPRSRLPRTDGGPTVGGVLLAAGTGTRFEDGNKLLVTIDGDPVVYHAARMLRESAVTSVVVVTGYRAEAVRGALDGLGVSFAHNPAYADGQSTSVRTGIRTARERRWDAAVLALGDMPTVDPASVDAVLAAYEDGEGTILAASYDGQRGNPVLFDATHFDALADVTGDHGGRHLVETHPDAALVETGDPGVLRDVDTGADLADLDG